MDSALPKGIWIAIVAAVVVAMFGIHYSMKPRGDVAKQADPVAKEPMGSRAKGSVKVVIDPGHGGDDGGAVVFSLLEKEITLDLASRVHRALDRKGVRAVLTRSDDSTLELEERVAIARNYPGAPFVSIHMNRYKSPSVQGSEVYVMDGMPVPLPMLKGHARSTAGEAELQWSDTNSMSQGFFDRRSTKLGESILESMTNGGELKNRGVRQRKLFVVQHAPPPAVLVECGYLSNPAEARKFSKTAFREKMAEGIAEGIIAYLNAVEKDSSFGFIRENNPSATVLTTN